MLLFTLNGGDLHWMFAARDIHHSLFGCLFI